LKTLTSLGKIRNQTHRTVERKVPDRPRPNTKEDLRHRYGSRLERRGKIKHVMISYVPDGDHLGTRSGRGGKQARENGNSRGRRADLVWDKISRGGHTDAELRCSEGGTRKTSEMIKCTSNRRISEIP